MQRITKVETRTVFRDLDPSAFDEVAETRPRAIGGFTILDELGHGGMGTVYLAEQEHPRRRVAVKVMRRGAGSRTWQRRFEREAELLGRLEHPNVARIFAAGTHHPRKGDGTPGPVPFIAMEYVEDGRPLTDFVSERGLDLEARLRLFLPVVDAVRHAHEHGVVHRDLKPQNVLVDGLGRPKIIDYGIARRIGGGADPAATTIAIERGRLVGTLQYMSPEQTEVGSDAVDVRSDLYALGLVLYELLTGRLPYDLTGVPLAEATGIVRHETPARPSRYEPRIPAELDDVMLRLLEKNPVRRTPSAEALRADLEPFGRGARWGAIGPKVAPRGRLAALARALAPKLRRSG